MTTTIDREQFEDALDELGLDVSVREDYSGRGMYGDECLAVVCGTGEFALLCAALGASIDDWDWLAGARADGMGLSTVWYWPGVRLEEEAMA